MNAKKGTTAARSARLDTRGSKVCFLIICCWQASYDIPTIPGKWSYQVAPEFTEMRMKKTLMTWTTSSNKSRKMAMVKSGSCRVKEKTLISLHPLAIIGLLGSQLGHT
jgi:hypothetical protein